MEIRRDRYLERLIAHKGNGRVKIVTGIRRCGKSYLLFQLFKRHLIETDVKPNHIIEIQLEDRSNKELRNPDACLAFIKKQIKDQKSYYLLIDEVQLMDEFEDVLNSCLHIQNLDTYVTGSNSKFLSKDIITEFRGRGDEMYLRPLSFKEYRTIQPDKPFDDVWTEYMTFGGLPYCALLPSREEKADYLKRLFDEVFLRDIIERNRVQNDAQLESLLNVISSAVGSLTNPKKLEDTFTSSGTGKLSAVTIKQYLDYLCDAFMIERAERYDIKGKRYISTPYKYYFTDTGLRNARLNFRQLEETHLMENVMYNELCLRGYSVDVGVVEINERQEDGKYVRKQIEVDFVCNKADERVYVQSAFSIPTTEKRQQEERPLVNVGDGFRKVVVTKDNVIRHNDENGILIMSLQEYLMDERALEK
ncbi:MAG: ATP-binding protein [Bacteroidaceae bacterium]|nr:ATP-binding protein [Bacteroidaceae bacterium]